MLVSLTVGKVDAGVAVLLTEDKRLIEFPSILLPADIHSGSIVDINVSRNQTAEQIAEQRFSTLQREIYNTFGSESPQAPVLRCRNATQTSLVLEWDELVLATASLRSLSLYRNGAKAGNIPRDKRSTKISGLAVDTEYTFQLVLRTSAGTYSSERLTVRTHKMTDLSGITITPGVIPAPLRESLAVTVQRIGCKLIDTVRIDTTHFVCTEPRGSAWEKAVDMNVPVVVPDWVKGCEREGRIVGVRGYYLDADPKLRQMGPSQAQQQLAQRGGLSTAQGPRIEHTPPTPDRPTMEPRRESGTATSAPTSPAFERGDPSNAEGNTVAGTTVVERPEEEAEKQDGGLAQAQQRGAAHPTVTEEESSENHDDPSEREDEKDGDADDDNDDDADDESRKADAEGKFDEVAL